jgi:hypothetical protein
MVSCSDVIDRVGQFVDIVSHHLIADFAVAVKAWI